LDITSVCKNACGYTSDHCNAEPFVQIILTLDSIASNKNCMYQETNHNSIWHHTNHEQQLKSPTWALVSLTVFHYFSQPLVALCQFLTPTPASSCDKASYRYIIQSISVGPRGFTAGEEVTPWIQKLAFSLKRTYIYMVW
jgi:hypothetical protein